jgi:hypothetical protein
LRLKKILSPPARRAISLRPIIRDRSLLSAHAPGAGRLDPVNPKCLAQHSDFRKAISRAQKRRKKRGSASTRGVAGRMLIARKQDRFANLPRHATLNPWP